MNQQHGESYEKQAAYYDAIYEASGKDYESEAEKIHHVIQQHKQSSGGRLLDVGCGTGGHFTYLSQWYSVKGLDLDGSMLQVARQRFPSHTFHQGDMVNFQLEQRFDIITCLFSAIGYTKSLDRMKQAVHNMSHHLAEDGILVVEPWFTPDNWNVGRVHVVCVDKPDLKITRMSISEQAGSISFFTFHFLVAAQGKIEYFTELHELGLFTEQQYREAFTEAGLEIAFDPQGITGRGLYIGVRRH